MFSRVYFILGSFNKHNSLPYLCFGFVVWNPSRVDFFVLFGIKKIKKCHGLGLRRDGVGQMFWEEWLTEGMEGKRGIVSKDT